MHSFLIETREILTGLRQMVCFLMLRLNYIFNNSNSVSDNIEERVKYFFTRSIILRKQKLLLNWL